MHITYTHDHLIPMRGLHVGKVQHRNGLLIESYSRVRSLHIWWRHHGFHFFPSWPFVEYENARDERRMEEVIDHIQSLPAIAGLCKRCGGILYYQDGETHHFIECCDVES